MANAEDQALRYAELIDMHSRDAAEFLEQWKTTVTAAMQASSERTVWVLDYGCGTCPYVETFLGAWQQAVPDESTLKEEVGKLETAGFDLILSSYVFHFIQNKEDCVRALCQVLNVGGHLMITTTEDTRADSLAGSRRHLPMLQLHDLRNLRSSRVLSGRILFSMRPCAGADEQEIERRNARLKHCFIEPGAAVCEMAERQSGVQRVALEVGEAGYCYSSLDHMLAWFFAMTHGAFDASLVPREVKAGFQRENPGQVVLSDTRFRVVMRRAS